MTVLKTTGNINQMLHTLSRPGGAENTCKEDGRCGTRTWQPLFLSVLCHRDLSVKNGVAVGHRCMTLPPRILVPVLHYGVGQMSHSLVHLFNKYLSNNNHVPGTVPNALGTVARKIAKGHLRVYILICDIYYE